MAKSVLARFNTGKLTSNTIDEQYQDEFWSKGAIREAQRKRVFTQLGSRLTQPKHWGDIILKERHLPILHPLNQLDGGVHAETAQLVLNTFYAFDKAGVLKGTFQTNSYANAAAAEAAAKTAAGTGGKVSNGAGSLYNGDADYNTLKAAYPALMEEGGNVNGVNTKSITVKGKVSEFGLHMKFTQRSIDMDSREGVLAQKAKDLGEAKGDIYESQVQSDLLAASEINRIICGSAATVSAMDTSAVLTYKALRVMEQDLKKLLIPRDTQIIAGSTKISTVVISKAYYAYVGQELYPTLQDMTADGKPTGKSVWEPLEAYKDGAGSNVAEGEIGRIGGFRFIEVANMQKYAGAGKDGAAAGFHTSNKKGTTNPALDVFPVLFIGSDSFATIGFEGDSSRIKTAMPKPNPYTDPFGKIGSMSIAWYHGTLIYRPERIRQLVCVAKIS